MSEVNERLDRIERAILQFAGRVCDTFDGALVDASEMLGRKFVNAPPPKSPAQSLVDLANSLPQEVFGDAAVVGSFRVDPDVHVGDAPWFAFDRGDDGSSLTWSEFPLWLLGVMSAYVGAEQELRAHVTRYGKRVSWTASSNDQYHDVEGHDAWLRAHVACCLAIAEKRRKA